jgi:hypothetical protein
MLKVDAELLFQTNVPNSGYCNVFSSFLATSRCPLQSEPYTALIAYTNNVTGINYFFGNFSSAWQKMTEYTYDDSSLANVGTALSVSYPQSVVGVLTPTASPVAGNSNSNSSSSTTTIIIAVVVGAVGGMLLVLVMAYFCCYTKQITQTEPANLADSNLADVINKNY